MRREVAVPVHVGNDANAAALAVHTFHDMASDFLLVQIEHGVGAGLVVGDMLVEGSGFTAGEIGHLVVDENGERWTTIGVSPNIIDASFQALMDSIVFKLVKSGAPV